MTPSELSDLLWAQVDRVAPHLLPNGKKEGHEWVAGNVNGDKGNSLKVNLSGKKKWADFAEGDGGDMLDLWMACRGINLHQAMQEAKAFLGIKDDDHHFDAKREKKFSRPDRKKIARYVTRTESHLEYLQSRGISPEVVKRYEVVSGKVWNPEHEREARARGIPTMGSGRIFQIPEETIKCQPFECPDHFYVIGGMDFGWDHPQAQVQLWWDKDADTIYVSRVWKAKEKTAVQAWGAVKSWAHKVPTAWPHDGNQHEKGGGEQLKGQYADAGFMMLQEHATWLDGGNAVEPGITELRDMMLDGRFKVFNTCEPFFEEFRLYHRDENGKIVKLNDDVLSAVRYAYMMRRFAKMMRDIKKPKEKKIPAPIRPIARRT